MAKKRRRLLRYFVAGTLVTAAAVVALVLFLWQGSRMAPRWYAPPDPADTAVVELADRAEYALMVSAQKVRPLDEDWTIEVSEPEVNAWLATRLSDWLLREHGKAWPKELGPPQVHLRSDRISVAIDPGEHTGGRVIVVHVVPALRDDQLWFSLDGVGVGRVPVPGGSAEKLVEVAGDLAPGQPRLQEGIAAVMDVLTGRTPVTPETDLADGRRARLRGLNLGDGTIEMTCRTLAGGDR